MPQTPQTPKPVQGWFIPSGPATPAKPKKLPLPLRIAAIAAVLTAVVLASHGNTDGQATTPPQTPAVTPTPTTAGTLTP
ncbi:hypothetical protein [Streptomyces chartreusis]|uniref:hypothetical protein n=1 Tax=Streptomyces chartreusis TaxID=1969 RepID=UPI0036800616